MTKTTERPPLAGWDGESGVRERLALLAEVGPDVEPRYWGYHASRDYWYACGPRQTRPACCELRIRQEGSESLRLIAERWGLDRPAAMAMIGHPDRPR